MRCESVCSSPADGQIKSVHVFHVKQYERQAEPCGNKIAKKCPAGFNHACRSVQGINKNTLIAQNIRVGTETYGAQLRRWAGTALLALPVKRKTPRKIQYAAHTFRKNGEACFCLCIINKKPGAKTCVCPNRPVLCAGLIIFVQTGLCTAYSCPKHAPCRPKTLFYADFPAEFPAHRPKFLCKNEQRGRFCRADVRRVRLFSGSPAGQCMRPCTDTKQTAPEAARRKRQGLKKYRFSPGNGRYAQIIPG